MSFWADDFTLGFRANVVCGAAWVMLSAASPAWAISSSNLPLDSPVYLYLEKLAGMGLITSDVRGIKPYTKAEAARLVREAEQTRNSQQTASSFADDLIKRIHHLLPREGYFLEHPEKAPPLFDYNPITSLRFRYTYLDGEPRNYERKVHDPGDDGVFGIGSGLRPKNDPSSWTLQRGKESTPLAENNNGVVYQQGHNGDFRWAAEGYLGRWVAGLVEPMVHISETDTDVRLNRGYLKLGSGALELEVGKDENWLGFGYRGSITLGNNAENLTMLKLSSPEPFQFRWFSWLGDLKYALIFSQLDETVTDGQRRQPWYYAARLLCKPTSNLEVGFTLGRQQGGPGVNNSLGDTLRGLIGGTGADNSNGMAGFDFRYRIPWLRHTEIYGEFSGEDTASFWPIVESYLAGFYLPRLTADGRDDLRFEFFQGNQILYTNWTFPSGYLYKGLPLGHSQGGATQDFFVRYSHWFSARNNLALEYMYTNRGMAGRLPGQAVERKHEGRVSWSLPLYGDIDTHVVYGIERISNVNLIDGDHRTNQLVSTEFRYRY